MSDEKIKRKDIPAAKDALRNEIADIAAKIRDWLHRPKAIPASVINAPLSVVQDYKQSAEDAATMYHVKANPGSSLSLAGLTQVRDKLREKLNTLEGVKS